uniref:Uncharacterized protein n=1 Tax=Panagrolaimus sp. JU765 TaxID=591449 RepID=A0AC34RD74_9BILA
MTASEEIKPRFMTPKEYLDIQRARGGCSDDFKQTMVRSFKLGVGIGVPFGIYVSYMNNHRTVKAFASKTFFTTLSSVAFFGAIGVMFAGYNCLKVERE